MTHSSIFRTPARLRRFWSWKCAIIIASLLSQFSASATADGLVLIERGLAMTELERVAFDGDVIEFTSVDGETDQRKIADVLALVRPFRSPFRRVGVLRLADGQVFPGKPSRSEGAPDTIVWSHLSFGETPIPLSAISAISLVEGPIPRAARADEVRLRNGDRLVGFVESIGEMITISVNEAGVEQLIEIPFERAATISLMTPPVAPSGRRVWLRDGTVMDVERLVLDSDGYAQLTLPAAVSEDPIAVSIDEIQAIRFSPGGMVALASLIPNGLEAIDVPRYRVPAPRPLESEAPLGLADLEFRGPLRVRYPLPEGAERFSTVVRIPPPARGWADFEVVVLDDGVERARLHLNQAKPFAPIEVELTGRELTIEVTAGAYGPILDVAIFERAIIGLP